MLGSTSTPSTVTSAEHLARSIITCYFGGSGFRLWALTSAQFLMHRYRVWDSTKQEAWRKAAQVVGCMESHRLVVSLNTRDGGEWHPQGGEIVASNTSRRQRIYLLHPGYGIKRGRITLLAV